RRTLRAPPPLNPTRSRRPTARAVHSLRSTHALTPRERKKTATTTRTTHRDIVLSHRRRAARKFPMN
ncbi:hypothetical protein IscW_ISCW012116, partial [Ixodes scapularis]